MVQDGCLSLKSTSQSEESMVNINEDGGGVITASVATKDKDGNFMESSNKVNLENYAE